MNRIDKLQSLYELFLELLDEEKIDEAYNLLPEILRKISQALQSNITELRLFCEQLRRELNDENHSLYLRFGVAQQADSADAISSSKILTLNN